MDKAQAQNLIKDLIEKTGASVVEVALAEESPEKLSFSVTVAEPHHFHSREGEGLFAVNHLVRKMIEAGGAEGPDVMVDINGFQKKRIENIQAVAHMMAERARYFKSNIEVDPMSPFDRRVVHEFLSKETDLETESIGQGPSRRVVIKYKGSV